MRYHPTPAARPLRFGLLAGVMLLAGISCTDQHRTGTSRFNSSSPDEFSVMSYNLKLFSYMDRDKDGQEDDFKPESEISALVSLICETRPDLLAVQEIGHEDALILLQQRLKDCGISYEYRDLLPNESSFAHVGVLSRRPIIHSEPLTNFTYSIKGREFEVQRGFQQVDVQVNPAFTVRLINVHLKSKLFHEAGQTEMRRNEARLLAAHIRRLQKETTNINLVVCGDFNDSYRSAALRELFDQPGMDLKALDLEDEFGDRWTHFYRGEESYARIDYFLVNEAMGKRWIKEKSGIIRDQRTYAASDHRPIISMFRVKD